MVVSLRGNLRDLGDSPLNIRSSSMYQTFSRSNDVRETSLEELSEGSHVRIGMAPTNTTREPSVLRLH